MINIFVNFSDSTTSEEFIFGGRLLADMLPSANWFVGNSHSFDEFWRSQEAVAKNLTGLVLLLHSHHLIPGKECLERMMLALNDSRAEAVLPVDPHGWCVEVQLDYATLRGLERFTERLAAAGRRLVAYDGRAPTMQLMQAERLRLTAPEHWMNLLTPPATALLVSDAFVHPYHNYYAGDRAEIIDILPMKIGKLLDVGGGEGNFAALARKRLGCEVHLAELNPIVAAVAAKKVDRVWVGDFLSLPINDRYDCITLLDVVEHSIDPVGMLRRAGELLAPGGSVVASIPNLGHWSVMADLIEGRWDYLPVGIACWTHLRFFTRHTIEQTFHNAGLKVLSVLPVSIPASPNLKEAFERFSDAGLEPDRESMDAYAYHVVALRTA